MAQKKPRKESAKALLASIRKEMARPRIVESVQRKIAELAAAKVAETYP